MMMSVTTCRQRAFTLVEMAMVMVILGVLMAGILTGIKILQNAKIAATVGQVQTYRAAVTAFEKTYQGMPGDLPNAHKKLKGCQASGGFAGCELVPGGGAVTTYICKPGVHSSWIANADLCGSCIPDVDAYPCNHSYTSSTPCGAAYGTPWCNPAFCEGAMGGTYSAPMCNVPATIPIGSINEIYESKTSQVAVTGMVGDGIVGPVSWDMFTFRGEPITAINGANAVDAETLLFWYELKQAGLIAGVSDMGLRGTPKAKFGVTHPFAEISGGFWAGHSDGCCGAGNDIDGTSHLYTGRPGYAGGYDLLGNLFVLVKIPTGGKENDPVTISGVQYEGYRFSSNISKNALTPVQAASIDRKLDDGFPSTGTVQAFGATATCYGGFGEPFVYDERETNKDCGLYIRIK